MVFTAPDLELTRRLVHAYGDTQQDWMSAVDGTIGRWLHSIAADSPLTVEPMTATTTTVVSRGWRPPMRRVPLDRGRLHGRLPQAVSAPGVAGRRRSQARERPGRSAAYSRQRAGAGASTVVGAPTGSRKVTTVSVTPPVWLRVRLTSSGPNSRKVCPAR
jgi:hypothetical protein